MNAFVISLDLELMWGSKDTRSVASYGANVLGLREAVPSMLALFKQYQVKATWAAIGLALFSDKKSLLAHLPSKRPQYARPHLSPYTGRYIESIGENERTDPLHYGLSLARMIADSEGMELASHTFSHYYCLENGQNKETFIADLEASIEATKRITRRPTSLVFPKNQFNPDYLDACAKLGFNAFRGNQRNWIYRESQDNIHEKFHRTLRFFDTYVNLTGNHIFNPELRNGLVNIPSSRFLRPYTHVLHRFESLRLRRIKQAMSDAAVLGKSFHLWWHPENFGIYQEQNLAVLDSILRHHAELRESYGVRSMTMRDIMEHSLD
jgi:peptidoglycan/xylan/chitin deacetylase (PgdA/CDA1 family)